MTTRLLPRLSFLCPSAEFRCAHGRKCVAAARVCDGRDDCQDLSDERDCERKTSGLCHHRCDGGIRCLPHTFLCDGEDDCSDGSDEKNCGNGGGQKFILLLIPPPLAEIINHEPDGETVR